MAEFHRFALHFFSSADIDEMVVEETVGTPAPVPSTSGRPGPARKLRFAKLFGEEGGVSMTQTRPPAQTQSRPPTQTQSRPDTGLLFVCL